MAKNDYLAHFNMIHLPPGTPFGGQFGPGDGDGDGIINDHANRVRNINKVAYKKLDDFADDFTYAIDELSKPPAPKQPETSREKLRKSVSRWVIGKAFAQTEYGKMWNTLVSSSDIKKAAEGTRIKNVVTNVYDSLVDTVAEAMPF